MLSFITNIAAGLASSRAYKAQAQSYATQAALAQRQGRAQRNAAYAEADSIETAARGQQEIAAQNLRTMRGNQRRITSTMRNNQGARGFTSEGTARAQEQSAQDYFDKAVSDAAQNASINSLNLWQTANATRQQGELAQMASNLQALQYSAAADQSRLASKNILNGTVINAIVGAGTGLYGMSKGYAQAQAYNQSVTKLADKLTFDTAEEKSAWIDAAKINPGTASVIAGDSAASWGFNTSGMLNVWTAGMTRGQNWGSNMSILMGNTPGIPDNRYSLSSLIEQ